MLITNLHVRHSYECHNDCNFVKSKCLLCPCVYVIRFTFQIIIFTFYVMLGCKSLILGYHDQKSWIIYKRSSRGPLNSDSDFGIPDIKEKAQTKSSFLGDTDSSETFVFLSWQIIPRTLFTHFDPKYSFWNPYFSRNLCSAYALVMVSVSVMSNTSIIV